MDAIRYSGGCLCGAVRYEASGAVSNLCYCHCASCRRAAGAPMVAWGSFARSAWRVARGALTEFHSSPAVTRGFCGACGTTLTYSHEARGGEIDVALATLDEPARLAPRMHIWVGDKLPWVVISDGRPQYPGFASEESP
jgi:hypothetical protein